MLKIPKWDVVNPSWVTWVHTIARDAGSLEPLGQLQCEEHVAQFAVAVGLEELPAEAASAQVLVHRQRLSNNTTQQNQQTDVRVGRLRQRNRWQVKMWWCKVSRRCQAGMWPEEHIWVLPLRNKSLWRQTRAQLEEPVLNMWRGNVPEAALCASFFVRVFSVLQKD